MILNLIWGDFSEGFEGGVIQADTDDVEAFKQAVAEFIDQKNPSDVFWRRLPEVFSEKDFETREARVFCRCRLAVSKTHPKSGEQPIHHRPAEIESQFCGLVEAP